MSGEEGITGARNIAREVNETFEVILTCTLYLVIIIIHLLYYDIFTKCLSTQRYYKCRIISLVLLPGLSIVYNVNE